MYREKSELVEPAAEVTKPEIYERAVAADEPHEHRASSERVESEKMKRAEVGEKSEYADPERADITFIDKKRPSAFASPEGRMRAVSGVACLQVLCEPLDGVLFRRLSRGRSLHDLLAAIRHALRGVYLLQ